MCLTPAITSTLALLQWPLYLNLHHKWKRYLIRSCNCFQLAIINDFVDDNLQTSNTSLVLDVFSGLQNWKNITTFIKDSPRWMTRNWNESVSSIVKGNPRFSLEKVIIKTVYVTGLNVPSLVFRLQVQTLCLLAAQVVKFNAIHYRICSHRSIHTCKHDMLATNECVLLPCSGFHNNKLQKVKAHHC